MDRIQFLVQGSADVPYEVTFQKESNDLFASCTCPAGQNGQFCKHRFRILGNIATAIVSANADQVAIVAGWLPGTPAASALDAVGSAELDLDRAKSALIGAKKRLATATRA
jgi:hypothetical protein